MARHVFLLHQAFLVYFSVYEEYSHPFLDYFWCPLYAGILWKLLCTHVLDEPILVGILATLVDARGMVLVPDFYAEVEVGFRGRVFGSLFERRLMTTWLER